MLRNNADARRCSYFELGLPVGKPLYREKTVYIKPHKTAINRPVDHTGET